MDIVELSSYFFLGINTAEFLEAIASDFHLNWEQKETNKALITLWANSKLDLAAYYLTSPGRFIGYTLRALDQSKPVRAINNKICKTFEEIYTKLKE